MTNLILDDLTEEELRERCAATDEQNERFRELLQEVVDTPSFKFVYIKEQIAKELTL